MNIVVRSIAIASMMRITAMSIIMRFGVVANYQSVFIFDINVAPGIV